MGPVLMEFVAIATLSLVEISAGGSCSAAKLCCEGRDSGCVIQKAAPNAIIESPQDKPCYCDHACLKLNDCCNDFRDTCRVVDCSVSEWGAWMACRNKCGVGVQTRIRVITKETENGGKHCPQLEQSRTCHSFAECRPNAHIFHSKEVALVASARIDHLDLAGPNEVTNEGYCATFNIVRASRACNKDFSILTEGSQVCVMCRAGVGTTRCPVNGHPPRLAGISRWKMLTSTSLRCHGKWIGGTNAESQCEIAPACRDPTRLLVFV